MSILIRQARVVDPVNNIDKNMDVFIKNGIIEKIGPINEQADEEIDAAGLVLSPGFVDIHVHFRSPGFEYKEDYKTGSYAAAAGGFTTVCTMANTNPVIDSADLIKNAMDSANQDSIISVLPVGAITKGFKGAELVDVKEMLDAGAVAFSEDGMSVYDEELMIKVLELSKKLDFPVICHCEDPDFEPGVVNEGEISKKLGVRGIPSKVEDKIVERDLKLAKKAGGRVHLTHNSTAGSIELIRQVKQNESVNVTCDVTPHHLSLDETFVSTGDSNFKMNPPLRNERDVSAIVEGIIDGTVDCIATDHAPHAEHEKKQNIDKAPFGVIGLETALSVAVTYLIKPGHINLTRLVELLSINPAKIIGMQPKGVVPGAPADLTLFSFTEERIFKQEHIKSKSKNSAFLCMELTGVVKYTIYNGKIIFNRGEIID